MKNLKTMLMLLFLSVLPTLVQAYGRDVLYHQGFVIDQQGDPVVGTMVVTFRIYETATDDNPLWEEDDEVIFDEGSYTTQLGDTNAFPENLFDADDLYLGIQVAGDDEMSPRLMLSSVPWAHQADVAVMAQSLTEDATQDKVLISGYGEVIDAGGNWVGPSSGMTGAQGEPGLQGEIGQPGAKGDKGDTGLQGLQGLPGAQGAQGIKGDKGDAGLQGLQGLAGATGAQGLPGAQGAQGIKGDAGAIGPQGAAGLSGAKGDKGDTGEQGVPGEPGLTGTPAPSIGNYVFAYDTTTQSVALANTFQDITFDTNAQLNGWQHAAGAAVFTCDQTGLYRVDYRALVNGGIDILSLRSTLNGNEIPGSQASLGGSSINTPITQSFLVPITAGDYLTFQLTGTTALNQKITGTHGAGSIKPSITTTIVRIQ